MVIHAYQAERFLIISVNSVKTVSKEELLFAFLVSSAAGEAHWSDLIDTPLPHRVTIYQRQETGAWEISRCSTTKSSAYPRSGVPF